MGSATKLHGSDPLLHLLAVYSLTSYLNALCLDSPCEKEWISSIYFIGFIRIKLGNRFKVLRIQPDRECSITNKETV